MEEYKKRSEYRVEAEAAERFLGDFGINVHDYGMKDAHELLDHWLGCVAKLKQG